MRSEWATSAQLWGITVSGASADDLDNRNLAAALFTLTTAKRMMSKLIDAEQAALKQVRASGGMILSTVLERSYGSIHPYHTYHNPRNYLLALKSPPLTTERLFLYRLISADRHAGQSVYVIPTILRSLLSPVPTHDSMVHLTLDVEPPVTVTANVWERKYNLIVLLTLAQAGKSGVATGRGINKASLVRLTKASVQAALDSAIVATNMTRFLGQASGAPSPANVASSRHERSGQHGQLADRSQCANSATFLFHFMSVWCTMLYCDQ